MDLVLAAVARSECRFELSVSLLNSLLCFVSVLVPNPPGPIKILNQTTSSIQVEWGEAPLMSSGFDYKLLIYPTGNITVVPSHNTSFTFTPLLSGTPYNISVKTVGPMGLESGSVFRTGVSTSEAFTLRRHFQHAFICLQHNLHVCLDPSGPHVVQSLQASPQETSITVSWDRPLEYKQTYYYNVSWRTGTSEQYTISKLENINIPALVPGTLYILSVTTETADGTQAAPITTQTWTSRIYASMFSSDL